ncbi:MAG: ABC transporter substrate-binding protein [Defluviitaleaceae bacterium]|nr:ABC transporter substrate-binding protein [Defluviitaleaceae bacterium]
MKKVLLLLLVVTALALTALTACRGNEENEPTPTAPPVVATTPTPQPQQNNNVGTGEDDDRQQFDNIDDFRIPPGHPLNMLEDALTRFPQHGDNGLPHVQGTIFQRGIIEPSPWQGVIGGALFSMSAVDAITAGMLGTDGGLIEMNEFDQFGEGGVWTVSHDMASRSITITQHYDVNWHDGAPLTLYDLYFTLHVMAHPDHKGPRHFRTGNTSDIVGIWEYNAQEADRIEGLVLSNNNRALTIYFNEFAPTIMYFGVWTSPMPAHLFSPYYPDNVADMIDSPYVRETPIGWGPFKFVHAEPGESYLLTRNEDYVWGVPHIENVVIRRISGDMVADAMVAGEFDAVGFRQLDFPYHMEPDNWRYFGSPGRTRQSHYAFRMGWWCFETDQNVSEMNDRVHEMMRPEAYAIRKAMALAIDWLTITQVRYNGLSFPAGSYLPIRHRPLMDLSVPMFPYDPVEANRVLDEAGFTNRDSEGYRTWLDGSRMDLIWAMAESPTAEWYYMALTQAWGDVGIRVSLWQGMFHDIWTIWDAMDFDDDDDEVHFWTGGWDHGANPANSMWAREEFENASRHNSPELDAILARINSMDAWDMDFLMEAMSDLQWYMYNTIFYFPSTWGVGLTAVNNRVANWDTRFTTLTRDYGWHTIRLTADQPVRG